MNEAIKKAIEGGYDHDYQFLIDMKDNRGDTMFLLDPLFWQALGKALGWADKEWVMKIGQTPIVSEGKYVPWKHHAHDYFDLVLTSGDTEKFWLDLLNPNRE